MVRHRVSQQFENVSDGVLIERELAIASHSIQEFGCGGSIPRFETERRDVVNQSGKTGAAQDALKSDRSPDKRVDLAAKFRCLTPMT